MARCDVWLSGFIYKGAAGMRPVSNQAMDDVHGCTSVAGGMDAGSDRPVCELHSESQPSQHVCAIIGVSFSLVTILLDKQEKVTRPSVRERI